MREIKFRGYSDYHKMWYYGSLVKIHRRYYIYNTYGNRFEVLPESVGEYTGLKDKNGKEIYEGDIVKCVNKHIGVVEWENNDCCFNVSDYYNTSNDYPTMAFIEGQPFEIIGNIHENPELLK